MKINKGILEEQFFTFNKMFLSSINYDNFFKFCNDNNGYLKIEDKDLDVIINKIHENIEQILNKYDGLDKKEKKYRTYGVISIFLFLLGKYYYNNILKKNKYGNYEYNIFKRKMLKDNLNISKYILESEIIDMVLFYQFNNGFLNYVFFKKIFDNKLNYENKLLESQNNIVNEYNLYIVEYHDFKQSEINFLITIITKYFEMNKKNFFFKKLERIINSIDKKVIFNIKERLKNNKKYNSYWLYFPDIIKKEIIKIILENIYSENFKKYLGDNNINIKIIKDDELNVIYKEIIKEIIYNFNKTINK